MTLDEINNELAAEAYYGAEPVERLNIADTFCWEHVSREIGNGALSKPITWREEPI